MNNDEKRNDQQNHQQNKGDNRNTTSDMPGSDNSSNS